MKKLPIYICGALWFLLFLLSACRDDDAQELWRTVSSPDEVTLTVGCQLSDVAMETRAFGEASDFIPSSASILILAFDENHLLTNVYDGEYVAPKVDEDGNTIESACNYYKVTLKTTDQPRILHFIVNLNEVSKDSIPFGTESAIFTGKYMTVPEGSDVYWQRLEFPDGINDSTTHSALSHLKLVRNFCKLRLDTTAATNLSAIEWGQMVIPSYGSVAPYISDQKFAYFHDTSGIPLNYDSLSAQGYAGNIPRTSSNKETFYRLTSVEDANRIDWKPATEPIYCFENEGSSNSSLWNQTDIFIRGYFDGDLTKKTYYRISLVDPTKNYKPLNMLRNISYVIRISSVDEAGYDTAIEAFTRASGNNVSGSAVTSEYNSINSSKALLRVEYMKKYILGTAPFTMLYRYVPDVEQMSGNQYISMNDSVELRVIDESYNSIILPTEITDENSALKGYTVAASDNEDGYRTITFKPNKPLPGGESTTTTVRFTVTQKGHTNLYRDVSFILRERYKLQNLTLTRDDEGTNSFTLTAEIPASTPQQLFPLDFTFESSPSYVYPNVSKGVMEVNSAETSIFDASNTTSFHFHRSLTWSEFNSLVEESGYKKVPFYFKLNSATQLTEGMEFHFGVLCDEFSPSPDADIDAETPSVLDGYFLLQQQEDGSYIFAPLVKSSESLN
jgi:hypothetical protein